MLPGALRAGFVPQVSRVGEKGLRSSRRRVAAASVVVSAAAKFYIFMCVCRTL